VEGDVPHLHLHQVVRRALGAGRCRDGEREQNGPFHGDSLGVVSAI
jgi:diadenosine tetraphosphate (Ap4A) HIT family hydrolase